MATLLLVVIYVGYISLGVPDSLFGAAWPAMQEHFGLPVSFGGTISVICSLGTFCSSLASSRLIARFGTWAVTVCSTALTAFALLGMSFAPSFVFLLVLCVPLGLGAGAIDSALNGYVALHYSARQMNFLHCFYGVGVMISPVLVSVALSVFGGFRAGFLGVSILQLSITLLLALSLPLWRQARGKAAEEEVQEAIGLFEMLRIRGIFGIWGLFFASCALEFTVGTWGATFLVHAKGADASLGALLVSLYYGGIALGRLLSGLLAERVGSRRLVLWCSGLLVIPVVSLFVAPSPFFAAVCLCLIGCFNGPIYPNLMHLTPSLFGRARAQSLTGSFLAVACIGITVAPALFGAVSALFGVESFVPFALAMVSILLFALFSFAPMRGGKGKDGTCK
ncbi:MAG: MFS transporter [Clostridia bacterium]|nr:MFS transporter [Clostridia bacterium]